MDGLSWDVHANLTEDLCSANEDRIVSKQLKSIAGPPSEDIATFCKRIPLTHTTDVNSIKDIVLGGKFPRKGLLSFNFRNEGNVMREERWTGGTELGLHNFVTAYCGIHDPFAVKEEIETPIGIFLKPDHDELDLKTVHYMWRDFRSFCPFLHNEAVANLSLELKKQLFISPLSASVIMAMDIVRKFNGQCHQYWASIAICKTPYCAEMEIGVSSWKLVYNQFEHVPLDQFLFLLYPSQRSFDPILRHHELDTASESLYEDLVKELGQDRVIPYFISKREEKLHSFIHASYYTGLYYSKTGKPPLSVEYAENEVNKWME